MTELIYRWWASRVLLQLVCFTALPEMIHIIAQAVVTQASRVRVAAITETQSLTMAKNLLRASIGEVCILCARYKRFVACAALCRLRPQFECQAG